MLLKRKREDSPGTGWQSACLEWQQQRPAPVHTSIKPELAWWKPDHGTNNHSQRPMLCVTQKRKLTKPSNFIRATAQPSGVILWSKDSWHINANQSRSWLRGTAFSPLGTWYKCCCDNHIHTFVWACTLVHLCNVPGNEPAWLATVFLIFSWDKVQICSIIIRGSWWAKLFEIKCKYSKTNGHWTKETARWLRTQATFSVWFSALALARP